MKTYDHKDIDICGVNLDIHSGTNGIVVSGGADSAVLLYAILINSHEPLHVYTCSSRQKGNVAPLYAYRVLLKCMELTGNFNCTHTSYFVDVQNINTLFSPINEQITVNNINLVYTGATALPPDGILASFKNDSGLYSKRDPNVVRPLYNGKYYAPFFNIDKSKIAEMYRYYGLMDTLFPLTRSCESLTLREGHCGECWWCEERKWAFGRT